MSFFIKMIEILVLLILAQSKLKDSMDNTSYQELLKTPEWGSKKIEILKRDNYTCQRCGTGVNSRIKTLETKFEIKDNISFTPYPKASKDFRKTNLKFHPNLDGFPIKTNLSVSELNHNLNLVLICQYRKKDNFTYPFVATLGEVYFDPEVQQAVDDDLMINLWRKHLNISSDLEIDLEGIYLVDRKDYSEVAYLKNSILLEVHHKCYRKNVSIWDQANDEYVTLCNICHDITHENQDIPWLDERDRKVNSIKCDRCYGKGYLPHYRYVQNGVCFKCSGWGKFIL